MTFVLSLGGSIFVPDSIDVDYLRSFKEVIESTDDKFVIVTGGGNTARSYMHAAAELVGGDPSMLGVLSCRINAQLVKSILDDVYSEVVLDACDFGEKTLVIGAKIPGTSSDFDAVKAAVDLGFETVVNLSNIDYVYDKDPKLAGAKPFEKLTWDEYFGIVGEEWSFGKHVPFDQIASKLARDNSIKVVIANGKDLENLKAILSHKPYKGTTIHAY